MSSALGGANSALAEPEADVLKLDVNGRKRLRRRSLAFASDARLARRAAGGDPAAFEEIFRRYQQDLYRFCVGILREPQDAQDAVQNTMIRAMRALPGETREMQLKPWLYRIAHNEAVELRRRERPVEPLSPTVDDATAGTEERAEQYVRLQTLLADIADLPERQRASLVMRELNGLGFGEIGAALGTSPGAVRQALYEARRGLGQMESGRDMDCDVAMRQVSDADGSPTRRGIRAHLRGCLKCRRFQAEIRERRETLAAISPMPVIALAALVKGGLGGSAAGGSAAASGAAAGGTSAAAGSSSVAAGSSMAVAGGAGAGAGGIGAGALGVSGLVKATAGLLAVLAVGTVAVDHGGILRQGQDPGRPEGHPAQVRGVESAQVRATDAAHHPLAAGHRAGAAGATAANSSPGSTGKGLSVADERGKAPASAEGGPLAGRSPTAANAIPPPVGAGAGRHPTAVTEMPEGNVNSPALVGDGQGSEKPTPGHQGQSQKGAAAETKEAEKAEAKAEQAQAKTERSEAKARQAEERAQAKGKQTEERAQAKAEKREEKAQVKAERSEERSQGKSEKAEEKSQAKSETAAKPEKTEAKEHPPHPEHGNAATSPGGPATPAPESTTPPSEPTTAPPESVATKEHPEHPEHPVHPEKSAVGSAVTKVTETTEAVTSATSGLLPGASGN